MGSKIFDALQRSFRYVNNSKDPSIDPLATPQVIFVKFVGLFIKSLGFFAIFKVTFEPEDIVAIYSIYSYRVYYIFLFLIF